MLDDGKNIAEPSPQQLYLTRDMHLVFRFIGANFIHLNGALCCSSEHRHPSASHPLVFHPLRHEIIKVIYSPCAGQGRCSSESISSEVARKSGERRKEEMELLFHEVLIGYQC